MGLVFAIANGHDGPDRYNIGEIENHCQRPGHLEGSGVQELMRACQLIEGEFVLDLTGVRSADPKGIDAIRKLVSGGAKLRGASPFIRLLLEASADEN